MVPSALVSTGRVASKFLKYHVRMTRTWVSLSYARNSAVVSTNLGVRILSIEGSEEP